MEKTGFDGFSPLAWAVPQVKTFGNDDPNIYFIYFRKMRFTCFRPKITILDHSSVTLAIFPSAPKKFLLSVQVSVHASFIMFSNCFHTFIHRYSIPLHPLPFINCDYLTDLFSNNLQSGTRYIFFSQKIHLPVRFSNANQITSFSLIYNY